MISYVIVVILLISQGEGQATASHAAEIRKYLEQGQTALKDNRPEEAAQAFRAILQIDRVNVDARADLGIVAMAQGNWTEAAEELQEALKLRPSDPRIQGLLGLCKLHLGKRKEASQLLTASFPRLDDPKLRRETGLQLFELWYQDGELQKADTVIGQLQELNSDDAAVLYAAYRVHSDLAFQAVDALALVAPDSAPLHRALAEHMVNEGHAQDAIAEYRKALQIAPGIAGVHYELGEALFANSHLEASLAQAQKEFEDALRLNPSDARSECKLADIELWRSNSATAFDHYTRALELDPEIMCANLGLAGLLIEQRMFQR